MAFFSTGVWPTTFFLPGPVDPTWGTHVYPFWTPQESVAGSHVNHRLTRNNELWRSDIAQHHRFRTRRLGYQEVSRPWTNALNRLPSQDYRHGVTDYARYSKKHFGGLSFSMTAEHPLDPRDDPESVQLDLIHEGYYLRNPCYSRRVFLGGLPPDWTKSYCFATYDHELSVRLLVHDCEKIASATGPTEYFMGVNSIMCKNKKVQVRPWILSDSYNVLDGITEKEIYDSHSTTVFVGGIPRPYTAMQLKVSAEAFGPVKAVLLHYDPSTKYPQGSGQVIFKNDSGYCRALAVRTLSVTVDGKPKEMEMKPFVCGGQPCSECARPESPIFCESCLKYFCFTCFEDGFRHPQDQQKPHKLATVNEAGEVKRWDN